MQSDLPGKGMDTIGGAEILRRRIEERRKQMTWTVNLQGHDSLADDAKAQFETDLQDRVRQLITELASTEGCVVTTAQVVTNTHGSVDLTDQVVTNPGAAGDAEQQQDG